MDFELFKKKCLEASIKDVEIYAYKVDGQSLSLFDGDVDDNKAYQNDVYSVRAIINNKTVSTYVENNLDDHYDEVIQRLLNQAKYLENNDTVEMYDDKKRLSVFENENNDFEGFTKDKQIKLLKDLTRKAKEYSNLCKTVKTSLNLEKEVKVLNNTNGLNKTSGETLGVITISAVCKKDKETRNSYAFQYFKNVSDINFDKLLKDSVGEALASLGATSIPTNQYKVVLSTDAMITLLRAFSSQFYATSVIRKMSAFEDKLNQKIFGDNITLIDDPKKNEFHMVAFDDEGVDTFKKNVIENGVLKTFLSNRSTAKLLNTTTTGNGFKSNGVKGNLLVSTTNLYLKEGNKTLDELFSDVADGVYITGFDGAHAGINPISGNFNLKSYGYLIENGKKTKPVTLIILSGNFFDMMNDVNEIGSDLEFRGGIGSPSVYVNKLNISGK